MKNFITSATIILLIVLLINQCRVTAHLKESSKTTQNALVDSVNYYTNKLGLEVAEKQTFIVNDKEMNILIDDILLENDQLKETIAAFKKVDHASSVKQTIKIDSVEIQFKEPVNYEFYRKFIKQTEFYSFSGEVNQFGLNINFISENMQTSATGVKKVGWLDSEYRTEITNSNPFIKTIDFTNLSIEKKDKRFGVGFSVGFGLYQNGFFVGTSVNYNLIEF